MSSGAILKYSATKNTHIHHFLAHDSSNRACDDGASGEIKREQIKDGGEFLISGPIILVTSRILSRLNSLKLDDWVLDFMTNIT